MENFSPGDIYKQLISKHESALGILLKKRNRLGWMRFLVFVLTIIISYYVFVSYGLWGIVAIVAGLSYLLYLVSVDVNNNQAIRNQKRLIGINKNELAFLSHDYHEAYDGSGLRPELHDYADDLDLFGKASLYQYINRCHTEQGRKLLARNLLSHLPLQQILERHEAVAELKYLTDWRQQFEALAAQHPTTIKTAERAAVWMAGEEEHFQSRGWKIFIHLYSAITIGSALAAIMGFIPGSIFIFLFGIYFTTSVILSRNTIKPYVQLGGIVKEVSTLQKMVEWIEQPEFQSALIKKLRNASSPENETASIQIRQLKSILDKFDLRLSIVGLLFFNSFLLWDIRQMMALNAWRRKNRLLMAHWFDMIGEMEVLHSLANLSFNHPHWCSPEFREKHFVVEGRSIAHPLIAAKTSIANDFVLEGPPKIGLITGSNMAGKSTFLRSLGVNFVLAQAGAVVCAASFTCSPSRIMSSMRIADNLAENTSTFYAELKKLKTIIEAVNHGEQVFILLDEILRGTNSYDRHLGSAALIAQLLRENGVAVIATHDVELAAMKEKFPGLIENYHFDVQVENGELYFDYKLREGICQSLNASILMKKIGIRLDESY